MIASTPAAPNFLLKLAKDDALRGSAVFLLIIILAFWNVVAEGRTLLNSNLTPGTIPSGAYGYSGHRVQSQPVLDSGAPAWDYEPDVKVLHDDLVKGVLPLWNPYVACGAPFLGNMFSAVLSPLRLLVAVVEKPLFWDIYLLARLFLAALLAFLFARRIGVTFTGSIIAGAVFMLSAHFVLEIGMPDLDVQILLPALLLAAEAVLRRPSYRTFVATALLVALIILGGMPESAIFLFLLSGLYFLVRMWILPTAHEGTFPQSKRLITFGGAGVAGLLISLPLVLPFFEYLRYAFNPRAPGVGEFHIDVKTAASVIMPHFFGHLHQTWNGVTSFYMLPYVGAASLLLALAALCRKRPIGWLTLFFATYATLYLLKAFGFPAIQWVGRIPLFNMSIFPKHGFPEFALCIGILAGIGAEGLLENDVDYFGLAIGSALLVLIVTMFAVHYWKIAAQADSLRTVVRSCLIVGFNTALLWGLAWAARCFGPRKLVALAMILFPTAELLAFVPRDRTQRYDPYTKPPFVDFLRTDPQIYRTFSTDKFLFPNTNAAYGIADIRTLDPLQVGRYMDLLRADVSPAIYDRFGGEEPKRNVILHSSLLDLMNVKYVLASSEIPEQDPIRGLPREARRSDSPSRTQGPDKFTLVYDREVKVYRNNEVFPRAFVVNSAEVLTDEDAILQRLGQQDFDASKRVILEEGVPEGLAGVNDAPATAPVTFDRYEPNYVRMHSTLAQPGWLVLTDTYYPGWRVRIDGKEGRILPADYIFRAVALNPGSHVVEFIYRPNSFLLGVAISLLAIAFLLILPIVMRTRTRSTGAGTCAVGNQSA